MLLKCPECDLQVSDKATLCPHCGYPLKVGVSRVRESAKRHRLPNGFGQIVKIKRGNLRNPYRASITVGKNPKNGRPIVKLLKPKAYFKTYNEAYEALVDYWKNPYDLEDDIKVSELYERWVKERLKNASDAYIRTTKSAWSYCSSLYTMRVKDLKPRHIKGCIEHASRIEENGKKKGEKIDASSGTKMRIKSLFNIMLDYAMEYEIVSTNAARNFEISDDIITDVKENKRSHIIFTENEMKTLWSHVSDTQYVDWILIQCYTGWRPQELATLKLTDIHLDQWYMQAGMKTPAGKQRIVPIHSRIQPLVLSNYHRAMEIGSEYLFNDKGQTHAGSWAVTYDKYRNRFNKVIQKLNLNSEHRAHDPRMTFITNGKKVGMDEYALKEMVGHSIQDITESTYTIRDLEWLRKDLEKLI